MSTTRHLLAFHICFIVTLNDPAHAERVRISGKAPEGVISTVAVAAKSATTSGGVSTTAASDEESFSLTVEDKIMFGSINDSNQYLPTIFGVLKEGRLYSVQRAIQRGLCDDGLAKGLTVLRESISGARFAIGSHEGSDSFTYLTRYRGSKTLRSLLDRSVQVDLGANCEPAGNATNVGMTPPGTSRIRAVEARKGDADRDGLPDAFDADADGDGILNPFDTSFLKPFSTFTVFSNLKGNIVQTVNSNTGSTPTRAEVDALLQSVSLLAMEVKGRTTATSELDCGTLSYCTAGGTGTAGGSPFPGTPGGASDTDGDGRGEMTRMAPANDFQLSTGASLPDINAGDTFLQIVTRSSGLRRRYFGKLDFVFKGMPAIKSLVFNPGSSVESTKVITYPVSPSMEGSTSNCFSYTATSGGDQILRLTAWRPQRAGIRRLGEADFVDLGGSDVVIDIPNPPCLGSVCSTTRTPNTCSLATYSESDANLSTSSGKLIDTRADADADATATITFDVDLRTCLAESGDTWDVGETLAVDLQFRSVASSSGSDNAAVKFCMTRAT